MSEKFTPGPWKFGKKLTSHTGEWLISLDRANHRGMQIAETRQGSGDESANASLIAAAPDMYEALNVARDYMADSISHAQNAYKGYEEVGGIPQMLAELAQVDAALAKAVQK